MAKRGRKRKVHPAIRPLIESLRAKADAIKASRDETIEKIRAKEKELAALRTLAAALDALSDYDLLDALRNLEPSP